MNGCWFSSKALADLPVGGIVDVELAQTGEGIAECELIKWFVHEVMLVSTMFFYFYFYMGSASINELIN